MPADNGRRTAPPSTVAELGAVTAALLLLATGYGSVVTGGGWFVTTALVVAAILAAIVVMRLIGLRYVVTPLALLVGLVIVAWAFVPGTLLGGLVPTPSTIVELNRFGIRARTTIIEEQAPVAAAAPVVLTMAAAFGLLVVLADRLLRARWALGTVGVLLLAVYLTPGLISGSAASPWLFVAVAAIWLLLVWARTGTTRGSQQRAVRPALAVGLGSLMAALAFPVVSPDIDAVATSWGKPPPQVFGRGINPMLELGRNLRRDSSVTALTYTTDLDDPPYLKVATLTDFTGRTWRPAERLGSTRYENQMLIDGDVEAEPKVTRITIRRLRSDLLPVPYPAVDVDGLDSGFRWERTGQTVVSRSDDNRGETYEVTSLDVQPTADQLRTASPVVTPRLEPFTRLPDDPELTGALRDISAEARRVTSGADTQYDRAMALQDYFRSEFDYSETAPVQDDYDGNGISVVREFLAKQAGYCVHFSSAMAIMARTLDMPARVAVGFAPGVSSGLTEAGRQYTVASNRLHAWTEIFFDGVGWVRFDPTPSVGQPSEFDDPTAKSSSDAGEDESQAPGTLSDRNAERGETAPGETAAAESEATGDSQVGRASVAVLAALVLIGAVPFGVRRARRWWRLRDDTSPDPAWREVQATAHDVGVPPGRAETPRGFAERLGARPGVDADALDRLLDLVEHHRFAPVTSAASAAAPEARAVSGSLLAGASRRSRWRARLLPRSLATRG